MRFELLADILAVLFDFAGFLFGLFSLTFGEKSLFLGDFVCLPLPQISKFLILFFDSLQLA